MDVRHDADGSLLAAVTAAPRALVLVTVEWSGPERRARLALRAAAARLLAAEHSALGVECFALDEDAEWCQRWLAELGVPQLGRGYPLGAGSMVWLEAGRAVSSEIGGGALSVEDIVARSLSLWSDAA
jgi:hypothetical protein